MTERDLDAPQGSGTAGRDERLGALAATVYDSATSSQGEPWIVLLHSLGLSRRSWVPFATAFASRHRCLAVDTPGHGESNPAERFATIEDLSDQILEATQARVGDAPIVLVGNSMGATLATELAARSGSNVQCLVLVGGAVFGDEPARRDWLHSRSELLCHPDGTVRPVDEAMVTAIFGTYDADRHRMMIEGNLAASRHLAHALWALYSYDIAEALTRVEVPVLSIYGERDWLRESSAPVLRQAVDRLDERVVTSGGHLLPVERPNELVTLVGEWLGEQHSD